MATQPRLLGILGHGSCRVDAFYWGVIMHVVWWFARVCMSMLCVVCEILSDDGECARLGQCTGGCVGSRVVINPHTFGLWFINSSPQASFNGLLVSIVAVRLMVELGDRQTSGHADHTVCAVGCASEALFASVRGHWGHLPVRDVAMGVAMCCWLCTLATDS